MLVESITEVPDLQVAKLGKSSILCLLSVVSRASTITAEAIIVIQMRNKKQHKFLDIALTIYCSSLMCKSLERVPLPSF